LTAERPSDAVSTPIAGEPLARRARAAQRPDARLSFGLAASLVLVGVASRELLRFAPPNPAELSANGHVEEWFFEPSDSSPLVILVLCGWLLWRRRARLAALWGMRGHWAWTAGPWLAAAAIFFWAVRAGAPELEAIALVPALLGGANLLGGLAALRVVAVPAAVLAFAVPIPAPLINQILWHLQIWTANFTGWMLQVMNLPVVVSGDRILLHQGLFAIIETCSGLRSIETLALLSILMIELFGRRGAHALILIAISPFVAFLINGLRCLGLIFNPHADIESIHSLQGIAMLLGGVLLLYFLDGALARFLAEPAPISKIEQRARRMRERGELAPRVALLAGFSALLVAISLLPRFAAPAISVEVPINVVERTIDGWQSVDQQTDWVFLGKTGFGGILNRRYTNGAETVEAFVAQAPSNARLRSYLSPKVGFPGSGWANERERPAQIAGRAATLRVVRKGATRSLVATWFEESPGLAVETTRALLSLDSSPFWVRSRIPLAVRISTPLLSAEDAAIEVGRQRLEQFAEQLAPALQTLSTPRES
jgi:EpsI family protein